ncbi:MAG: bifunctional 2-keto-4-hydroxyglutarate aldolase/2-keto-3-deoxy-6-phosphogluconate aldolase [Sporolactobacillus sp.]|jgi:2-dehydro-3-deoxyphosphogluconate aldolase/(4S)-4-hydroxy-2-oxoglutarate aldolase|nr:bifunctional 2-keto-4-hydroxyglutarate aldolase/2-keto-3-deoxy-6-phosphogluconate aldolase [Sporolactobacillus sp.]
MQYVNTLKKIEDEGIVAVVRADSTEKAKKIIDAIHAGGINAVELTYTIPDANSLIKEFSDNPNLFVGAGTVLDAVSARISIIAGARFIVSPLFDEATAKMCNLYQIPYIPGCMTVNEAKHALEAGANIIKLFPGSVVGSKMIKSIKAPLPQVNIMVTGGVNTKNIKDWFVAGCTAVGTGGSLTKPAETGDYESVSKNAAEMVAEVRKAQKELYK